MPPLPGEERLLTVFADIHYYFSQPCPHPIHHRFEKGSYLYIYHDAAKQSARIEVANNPGLPQQDAFSGTMSSIHLRTSDKFPTLYTLTVDTAQQSGDGGSPGLVRDENEWRLVWMNPSDHSTSYLRLHTLDIYFWTVDDARLFLTNVQGVLAPHQLEVIPPPQSVPQHVPTSSLVQNLENIAISDPTYRDSKGESPRPDGSKLPPPPPPPLNPGVIARTTAGQRTSEPVSPLEETPHQKSAAAKDGENAPEAYTPLPYNPAAPAAPEPIKAREKTPPPPDDVHPTANSGMAYAPPLPPPQSAGLEGTFQAANPGQNFHIPPNNGHGMYSPSPPGATQPPYSPQQQQQQLSGGMSFGPPPTTAPSALSGSTATTGGSYAPSQQDPNAHLFRQQSFGLPPPVSSPYHPAQPQHQQRDSISQMPPPPVGGYAGYSYGQQHQQQQQPQNPYDVHGQVYRPTEVEAVNQHRASHETEQQGHRPGRITNNAMRVEKGVNRLFKKLEKRL
ncbi:hypothetical protein FQN57_005330 [Myotisia sp. PD_48]|nr:hypothetical protein FQN57_005330 [Myotisia sp. PD_48]